MAAAPTARFLNGVGAVIICNMCCFLYHGDDVAVSYYSDLLNIVYHWQWFLLFRSCLRYYLYSIVRLPDVLQYAL